MESIKKRAVPRRSHAVQVAHFGTRNLNFWQGSTKRGSPDLGLVIWDLEGSEEKRLNNFQEERGLDKALIPITDKVKVVANQEFEALFPKFHPSRVTITTNSGESHSTRVDVPKGDPRDPMTEEEIAVKFTALGGDVIGQEQCQKLQSYIMSMETAKNLGGLFELTTAQEAVSSSND